MMNILVLDNEKHVFDMDQSKIRLKNHIHSIKTTFSMFSSQPQRTSEAKLEEIVYARESLAISLFGFQQYVESFIFSFYLWYGGSTLNFSWASHFFPGSYSLLPLWAKTAINYSSKAVKNLIEYEVQNQVPNSSCVSFLFFSVILITLFFAVDTSQLLCRMYWHICSLLCFFLCFL